MLSVAPLESSLFAFHDGADVIAFRAERGLSRLSFWRGIEVIPSTAAKYEQGIPIPATTKLVLTVAYGSSEMANALISTMRGEEDWLNAKPMPNAIVRFTDPSEVTQMRKAERATYQDFWAMVEIERSRGAKYELGDNPIPMTVSRLLTLTFGSGQEAVSLRNAMRERADSELAGLKNGSDMLSRFEPDLMCFRDRADIVAYQTANRLTQTDFWRSARVAPAIGAALESGSQELPRLLQIIITLIFGAAAQAERLMSEMREGSSWQDAPRLRTPPALRFASGPAIRRVREERGLLQGAFWRRIDVKQARGNRYERGNRDVPDDVRLLLHLAYGPDEEAATLLDSLRSSGFGALELEGG